MRSITFFFIIYATLSITGAPGAHADSIVSWGYEVDGSLSDTPSGSGYTAIAGGGGYSVALAADGSIVSWGSDNDDGVSGTPSGTGYTAIATGFRTSLALATDGSIASWGWDYYGVISGTPSGNGYTAITAGGGMGMPSQGMVLS